MRTFVRTLGIVTTAVLLTSGWGVTQQAESPTFTVIADGQTRQVSSSARAVGDLLVELEVGVGALDRVSPAPATPLADGMTVSVIRVRRCRVTEEAAVPAKTVALAAPRLPAGYTKLLEQGRDGLVRRVVEVWEKDGQETQRTVLAEKVLVRARNTVVLRGAQGLPSRGGDLHQPLRMVATGYAAYHCGGSPTGHTASGRPAVRGVVAVDTRVIAMGTRLYIPGYGFAIAADRGSAIRGHRIDLCFDSYTEALRFGRRAIDVYVLR